MNAKVLITLAFITALLITCKKEVGSKQSNLRLISISADSAKLQDNINFKLEFSHPYTGDIIDTMSIWVKYKSCPFRTVDTLVKDSTLPVFNSDVKNDVFTLDWTYKYGSGNLYNGCSNSNGITVKDSATFYFVLKDRNGNTSDTIKTKKIALLNY